MAGYSNSNDGDVVGGASHGNNAEYWIFKIDSVGNILWQKTYGGGDDDLASSIIETPDKGLMVLGFSQSYDGDITDHHMVGVNNEVDAWLVRLDSNGNKIWAKSYGGTNADEGSSIVQAGNNYYLACTAKSTDGDVTGNHGGTDFWVVKINGNGNIIWQKSLGGSNAEEAFTIITI